MKTISPQAGTRLARAKAALDAATLRYEQAVSAQEADRLPRIRAIGDCPEREEQLEASHEYLVAAAAVADELVAQNFHKAEGDDA